MTLTQTIIQRERFRRDNTPEKTEARIRETVERLFPEKWVKEVAEGVMAGFAAQVKGF